MMNDGDLVEQGSEAVYGHSGMECSDQLTMCAMSSEKERQPRIFHQGSNVEIDLLDLNDLLKELHKAGYYNCWD